MVRAENGIGFTSVAWSQSGVGVVTDEANMTWEGGPGQTELDTLICQECGGFKSKCALYGHIPSQRVELEEGQTWVDVVGLHTFTISHLSKTIVYYTIDGIEHTVFTTSRIQWQLYVDKGNLALGGGG